MILEMVVVTPSQEVQDLGDAQHVPPVNNFVKYCDQKGVKAPLYEGMECGCFDAHLKSKRHDWGGEKSPKGEVVKLGLFAQMPKASATVFPCLATAFMQKAQIPIKSGKCVKDIVMGMAFKKAAALMVKKLKPTLDRLPDGTGVVLETALFPLLCGDVPGTVKALKKGIIKWGIGFMAKTVKKLAAKLPKDFQAPVGNALAKAITGKSGEELGEGMLKKQIDPNILIKSGIELVGGVLPGLVKMLVAKLPANLKKYRTAVTKMLTDLTKAVFPILGKMKNDKTANIEIAMFVMQSAKAFTVQQESNESEQTEQASSAAMQENSALVLVDESDYDADELVLHLRQMHMQRTGESAGLDPIPIVKKFLGKVPAEFHPLILEVLKKLVKKDIAGAGEAAKKELMAYGTKKIQKAVAAVTDKLPKEFRNPPGRWGPAMTAIMDVIKKFTASLLPAGKTPVKKPAELGAADMDLQQTGGFDFGKVLFDEAVKLMRTILPDKIRQMCDKLPITSARGPMKKVLVDFVLKATGALVKPNPNAVVMNLAVESAKSLVKQLEKNGVKLPKTPEEAKSMAKALVKKEEELGNSGEVIHFHIHKDWSVQMVPPHRRLLGSAGMLMRPGNGPKPKPPPQTKASWHPSHHSAEEDLSNARATEVVADKKVVAAMSAVGTAKTALELAREKLAVAHKETVKAKAAKDAADAAAKKKPGERRLGESKTQAQETADANLKAAQGKEQKAKAKADAAATSEKKAEVKAAEAKDNAKAAKKSVVKAKEEVAAAPKAKYPQIDKLVGTLDKIVSVLDGPMKLLKTFNNETCSRDFNLIWGIMDKLIGFGDMILVVVPHPAVKGVGKAIMTAVKLVQKGWGIVKKGIDLLVTIKLKVVEVLLKAGNMVRSVVPLIKSGIQKGPKQIKKKFEALLAKLKLGKLLDLMNRILPVLVKPMESSLVKKIVLGPIVFCQRIATKILTNKYVSMIMRPIKKINAMLDKKRNLMGKKLSISEIMKMFSNPSGAAKKILKPVMGKILVKMEEVKKMLMDKVAGAFKKSGKSLPVLKLPGVKLPKLPELGGVSPLKLMVACKNQEWVQKSPANLCNCCIMGMMDPKNMKGPMILVLLLREKICELALEGKKMTALPPPPQKKKKKKKGFKLKLKLKMPKLKMPKLKLKFKRPSFGRKKGKREFKRRERVSSVVLREAPYELRLEDSMAAHQKQAEEWRLESLRRDLLQHPDEFRRVVQEAANEI